MTPSIAVLLTRCASPTKNREDRIARSPSFSGAKGECAANPFRRGSRPRSVNSTALPAAQPLDPIGPNCPRRPETYFCRACGRFHVYGRTKLGVRRHSAGPITEDPLVGLSTNGTFDAAEMHLLHRFSNWMRRSHPKPLRSPFAAEFSRPPAEFQEKSGLDLGRGYTFPAGLTAADVEGIHAALWLSTQTDGLVVKLWRTIAQLNHLPALTIDSDQVDNAIIGVTSGFCWSDIEFFLAVGGALAPD